VTIGGIRKPAKLSSPDTTPSTVPRRSSGATSEASAGKAEFSRLTMLNGRTPTSSEAERQGAFARLAPYRDGAICMVNSPRSKLLHKKGLLALLSDRQLGLELSPEERSTIDASIPWTRLVRSEETQYEGERVHLPGFVLTQQDRLVLKPADDYGGRGVVLGWEVSPGEWEQSLEQALQQPYVVQEKVPVPEDYFPVWSGDSIRMLPFMLDTDPLLFRGKLGSVLTRISGSALLNVSAGTGSTTPTFAV